MSSRILCRIAAAEIPRPGGGVGGNEAPGGGGGEGGRAIRGITANMESRALNEHIRGEPVAFRSSRRALQAVYLRC